MMKQTLENKYIDVLGTELLTIINRKAEAKDYFPILKNDIEDISKTKKIHLDNIQELFTYLVYSEENYKHYYEGLKTYILEGMCPAYAVKIIDNEIEENENIFLFLDKYFEYEFTIDGMVRIEWREDNEY